jgi:hypothetical protein
MAEMTIPRKQLPEIVAENGISDSAAEFRRSIHGEGTREQQVRFPARPLPVCDETNLEEI